VELRVPNEAADKRAKQEVQSNLYISVLYICITSLLELSMPDRIWDYG